MTLALDNGQLSSKELIEFLVLNKGQFSPPLDSKVNLIEYSEKLIRNSIMICTRENKKIRGLLAFYANDRTIDYAYISLICVSKGWERKGIGTRLINECILYVRKKGYNSIKLEVNMKNQNAFIFYTKLGFQTEKQNPSSHFMAKSIF